MVGPNGAGKTTLLRIAMGLDQPTDGRIQVLGWNPQESPTLVLPRVGFVAQDRPLYRRFKVRDLLEFGRLLNPRWDSQLARTRIDLHSIPLDRPLSQLSGGQQAQVALTLVLAKRPELLLLDEPVSGLDPLARTEFLQDLMAAVAEQGLTVVLSSHIVSELERTCDYLVILCRGQVQVAGEIDQLLNGHRILIGPRTDVGKDPTVVKASHSERQTTLLVRRDGHRIDPRWEEQEVSLEELVLAYMARPEAGAMPAPELVGSEVKQA
jgi:ABC-2 type transport system ATP-binding protein